MGASAWADQVAAAGDSRTGAEHGAWRSLLYLGGCPRVGTLRYVTLCYVTLCYVVPDEAATLLDLAQAARSAGDAVMTRLWGYVKEDGGRIDEQIDKFTGDT